MRILVALIVLSTGVAGCLGASDDLAPDSGPTALGDGTVPQRPHAVVAIVDSGVQPYHEAFAAAPDWTAPPLEGAIALGAGFKDRAAKDLAAWNELREKQLYRFEGTRVFAISSFMELDLPGYGNPHLIYDDFEPRGHGTGTASLVAQTAPDATIVMVEAESYLLEALEWIEAQPWIDVVSISQGRVGNVMSNPTIHPDPEAEALKRIVDSGKLVVMAAGNEPTPTVMGSAGPPWVISVGGVEESTRGESAVASKMVDVVASFTNDRLADKSDPTGYWRGKGTSFGAPVVAGVIAQALYEARREFGNEGLRDEAALLYDGGQALANSDVRDALNATAQYWTTTEYDPTNYSFASPFDLLAATAPVLPELAGTPVGPWLQMGWGYVGPETIPGLVAVLSGHQPLPEKPAGAEQYMQLVSEAKAKYWDVWQGG